MASDKVYWKDDEIVCDRDGVPHYTGAKPELMREYRRRVLFCYTNLEGSGDDEAKEARSLKKKKARFGKRLLDNLHGEAWRVCQDLLSSPEALRAEDGYKAVLKCLQSIEKVGVVKKTEAFDAFFDKCFRKRGQSIDMYIRERNEKWADLKDLAEVSMTDDLLAYFLLRGVNLSKEEKRSILLANQSDYSSAGIEKALRVSFFDVHEKERSRDWGPGARKPKGLGKRPQYAHAVEETTQDEDDDWECENETDDFYANAAAEEEEGEGPEAEAEAEPSEQSDLGASGDDLVYQAYASYKESRKKLREVQKARGFTKPRSQHGDDRRQALEREKQRSRCAACNRIGHWAGDPACPKSAGFAGKNHAKGKAGRGKGRGSSKGTSKGKAYLVGDQPLYFSLREDNDDEAFCDMVIGGSSSEEEMEQDAGRSPLDDKRKAAVTYTGGAESPETDAGWEQVAPPFVTEGPAKLEMPTEKKTEQKEESMRPLMVKIHEVAVLNLKALIPESLNGMVVRELQATCDEWGIQTSGSKGEIRERLRLLFSAEPVLRKGCTTRYVQLN
eukprot:s6716_g6.t2